MTSKNCLVLFFRFIIALSLSLVFLVIELISFMIGISLFNSLQCALCKSLLPMHLHKIWFKLGENFLHIFLATLFHSSAAIALSCMVLYQWCSYDYWPVFAINSCLPVIFEFFVIIGVWIFKRPIS